MSNEITKDIRNYFMQLARITADRSTSPHRRVGAVLVKNGHIIATGYNGAAKGQPHEIIYAHPDDISGGRKLDGEGLNYTTICPRDDMKRKGLIKSGERLELCTEVHAEINVIIQCAVFGVSTWDSVLFCTHSPCNMCARAIINAGIKLVYFDNEYNIDWKILESSKIWVNLDNKFWPVT